MNSAFVYVALRTPFGRFGVALAQVRPDDPAATFVAGEPAAAPGLRPGRDRRRHVGCANQAGENNRTVGRLAVLLNGLKSSFRQDGTITTGNASQLNDGPSDLLGSEAVGPRIGRDPIAWIAGCERSAVDPQMFGYAPVEAAEAFAVRSLVCVDACGIDPEIVPAKGGAKAISHPLGASGGRLIGANAARLQETGDRYGVAAICIGQAFGVFLENVA